MTNTLTRRFLVLTCAAFLLFGAAAPALADFVGNDRVRANDTDTWRVWVPAGSHRVVVRGDGDTDLDCFVYDRFGTSLGRDIDYTDFCVVDFYQPASGYITIRIRNLGSVYNEYDIDVQ